MNWEPARLDDILIERKGRIKHTDANQLDLQRIKKIDFSGNIHLDTKTDTRTDMIRVKTGDLVISGINAAKGAIAVYQGKQDALATIHYSAYQFNPERISVDFLKWFFKSPKFAALLKEQVPGGIKTEIKPKHILPLKVKFPRLPEQLRIANRLNRFYSEHIKLMCETIRQESLLSKLKQAILQEAIQGKLTVDWRKENREVEPASQLLERIRKEKQCLIAGKKLRKEKPLPPINAEEIPFKIPEGWQWCRLGEVIYDACYGTSQKAYSQPIGVPVLRMGNISSNGTILYSGLKYVSPHIKDLPKLYLEDGDILFNRTNSYELVGKSGVHRNCKAFTYASYLIRLRMFCALSPEYVSGYINSITCRENFIEPNLIQQNGQANFNGTKLKKVPIPLPPSAEQLAIFERVKTLIDAQSQLEAEIKQSRSHTDNLLQMVLKEAFTLHE